MRTRIRCFLYTIAFAALGVTLIACPDDADDGLGLTEFECGSGEIISMDFVCEGGGEECADGSDEDCKAYDGQIGLLPRLLLCDGTEHTFDGRDEVCTPCADGDGAVLDVWLCDGESDCADASDEDGCSDGSGDGSGMGP